MNVEMVQGTSKKQLYLELAAVLILVVITAAGAFLRLRGLNWDSFTHIHPDERFLTMVETSIQIPSSVGEYFNTAESPLNPVNVGHTFFVYGTFPIFLVRLAAEIQGQTGYDEIHLVGRSLAAVFDIISIVLLYFLGRRMFNRWVGLLAAALYAFSVLPIQHSHFFVVDIFANTFLIPGFLFAFRVQKQNRLRDYLLFGVMLGAASACKISSLPFAAVIVGAVLIRVLETPEDERRSVMISGIRGLAAAAGMSFLIFRILQPYAFQGPGFFGVIPDSQWLANIREIGHQQSGDVDFPPALQWALRTPILFSLKNMVLWGFGIPLGLAAWAGWSLGLYNALRRRSTHMAMLLFWVMAFFLWQSTNNTPAMRYQLPVYPFLTLLAAWALHWLWTRPVARRRVLIRAAALLVAFIVLLPTAGWAIAFSSMYEQPNTHVAASRWIYENIPAAINLQVVEEGESRNEPVPISSEWVISTDSLQTLEFNSEKTLFVDTVTFPGVSLVGQDNAWPTIGIDIFQGEELLAGAAWLPTPGIEPDGITFHLDTVVPFEKSQKYRIEIRLLGEGAVRILSNLQFSLSGDAAQLVEVKVPHVISLPEGGTHRVYLPGDLEGDITSVFIPYLQNLSSLNNDEEVRIQLSLYPHSGPDPLEQVDTGIAIQYGDEQEIHFELQRTLPAEDVAYLELELVSGALVQLRGSRIVSESSWDLGLPARIDGRDGYGGLYKGGNLEMYWPDNQDDDIDGVPDKLERIVDELSTGDYFIISTNRQYGTIPRVPVRYPLSEAFYRALFDCPAPVGVLACGAELEPYDQPGGTGYELVTVFASHPQLGPLVINDQLAEEAFTVYDHPKVLVFRKTDSFNAVELTTLLDMDLTNVLNLPPAQLPGRIKSFELAPEILSLQVAGGTWSDLFNSSSLLNRSDILAMAVWWLMVSFLGWTMVPVLYFLMPGLRDRGYGFARMLGLIVMAWLAWMAGNLGIPVSRLTLLVLFLLMMGVSAALLIRNPSIRKDLYDNRRQILVTEAVALAAFLIFTAVRSGNPDLWHPAKGGEKPMNFAYLNAVLKSTYFPPYNPWLAGATINYYYFGYVIVGMPLKLLGIVPSAGYNLIVPTLFALSGLGVYSLVSNIVQEKPGRISRQTMTAGLIAVLLLVVLGNLGNARLFYRGLKQLGGGSPESSSFVSGLSSAFKGVVEYAATGESLPVAMDRWYWDASRVIAPGPGEAGPITEFPLFTFLYGDLHAHMIDLPITILTLGWAFSWLKSRKLIKLKDWKRLLPLVLLWGLSLGVIRPTNTWDYPLFWLTAGLSAAAAAWTAGRSRKAWIVEAVVGSLLLFAVARGLFYFYDYWYMAGYTSVDLWKGSHTTLTDYLTVLGLFYFILFCWLLWETRKWMEKTPLSALAGLKPYTWLILTAVLLLAAAAGLLAWFGITISLIVLPFVVWSMVLFLFHGELDIGKRAVLLLMMAASTVTFMVEVIVLTGDISRMNTVFKFYLQVWTLFSISSAAAAAWFMKDWQAMQSLAIGKIIAVGTAILVFGAAMYPLAAIPAKINDRMAPDAPRGLDGAAFMQHASYSEFNTRFQFNEDYDAIRWMQENVEGSPVIVEASIPEYRWGSRYSIYTGLPSVLGWNWHQRQQQVGAGSEEVSQRSGAVARFYTTGSAAEATHFLESYGVRYVVRGVLEQLFYEQIQPCQPGPEAGVMYCDMGGRPMGMVQPELHLEDCELIDPENETMGYVCATGGAEKYSTLEGDGVLTEVFRSGSTIIYEVIR